MHYIITGDLHLHDKPYADSLERSRTLLDDLYKLGLLHGKVPIILNGDIFHVQRPSYYVMMALREFKEKCEAADIPLIINIGNHDSFSLSGPETSYLNLFDSPGCQVVNKSPLLITTLEPNLLIAPWYPAETFKKVLKHTVERMDFSKPCILVAHQPITEGVVSAQGVKVNQDLSYKDLYPDRFLFVFLSDYHEHQQIHHNIWYIGAPIQTMHGEEQQLGPIGVTRNGVNYSWEHLELPSVYSEFKTYNIEEDTYIPDYDKKNYNRIKCPIELKADLQLLYPEASIIPWSTKVANVEVRAEGDSVGDFIKSFVKQEAKKYKTKREKQIIRKLTKLYYQKAREALAGGA